MDYMDKHIYKLAVYLPILILFTLYGVTDACSSRTTPRPRPPTPAPRPNITFPTYKCPPVYAAYYCLNNAKCFTVKIQDSLIYNCECPNGYVGSRCEYKALNGSYLPNHRMAMLQQASIAMGAVLTLVLFILFSLFKCLQWHQRRRQDHFNGVHAENGFDAVDGIQAVRTAVPVMRPFGPHHHRFIPLAEAYGNR